MICEKCGADMEEIQGAFSEGMECPNCGWGWVTTNIGSIADDNTDYEIWLQPGIQATEQWNVRRHMSQHFMRAILPKER